MPIIIPADAAAVATGTDPGLISFLRAKRMVARAIGGENKAVALDEAGDAILQAMEELSLHNWDFLLVTYSLSVTAGTADYTLPTGFKKEYTVRLTTNERHLVYLHQRDYDRLVATQSSGTPTHYSFFNSAAVEALDPQHTAASIRFYPTPASSDTATVKYYRPLAIIDDDGDTLDLPRRYQYWPVYQAKAFLLNDHGGEADRAAYWQRRADMLLSKMKWDDQDHPDQDVAFAPATGGTMDQGHPAVALYALDGF